MKSAVRVHKSNAVGGCCSMQVVTVSAGLPASAGSVRVASGR